MQGLSRIAPRPPRYPRYPERQLRCPHRSCRPQRGWRCGTARFDPPPRYPARACRAPAAPRPIRNCWSASRWRATSGNDGALPFRHGGGV